MRMRPTNEHAERFANESTGSTTHALERARVRFDYSRTRATAPSRYVLAHACAAKPCKIIGPRSTNPTGGGVCALRAKLAWRRALRASSIIYMKTLHARVIDGRVVVDGPSPFPEGTELELVIAESEDEMDDSERRALRAALARSRADVRAGRIHSLDEVIKGR